MYSAPAVSYPVGRSRFQGQLTGVLVVIACLTGLGWCAVADTLGWRQGLFLTVLVVAGLVAAWSWWLSPVGTLAWDGEAWRCSGALAAINGHARLHLDLQFCMLLCLRSDDGRRIWLWPEQRTSPVAWLALRRAVVYAASDRASRQSAKTSDLLNP